MAEAIEEEERTVDLLFCLDATGSMRTFIEGVRDGIKETVGRVVHDHPDAEVNLGFVAYRDWSDEGKAHPRIQKFPFTPSRNVGEFQQFVGDLKATGGGDYPEDVLGGLWESANMNWTAPTRLLFHIFDAPPHGRDIYHSCPGDLYPDGHPSDRPLDEIFRTFKDKNIDYRMMIQGRYPLDQMVDRFKAQKAAIGYEKFNECPSIKDVAKIMSFVGKTVSNTLGIRPSNKPRPVRDNRRDSPVRPMARASEYKVYCGIDFGTHGSAFATCTAEDPIPREGMWAGNGVSAKTLTNVLLNSKKKLVEGNEGFGLAALEKYMELDDDERRSYFFFRRFKMELYKDEVKSDDRKEVDIADFLTAEDRDSRIRTKSVLVEALKFIIGRVMDKVASDYKSDVITKEDIQWILTVPAIWSQKSRRTMEKVAYKAGIPQTAKHDQLIVALEPECACVAAQKEMRLEAGDCYMMIDCGGGTVDIACHQMTSNTSVKEIHPPSGGPWGSTYIDDVFWNEYLPSLFGRNVMERVTQADKEAVIHNFVTSKAMATPTEATRKVRIDALMEAIGEEYGSYEAVVAHLGEVQFPPGSGENCGARLSKYGNLVIDRRIWDYMFDSVISKLIEHVRNLLEKDHLRERIQTLCIVGGFAMSAILRDRLSTAFSDSRRIFRPSNPMLAVVTGAAMFGLSPSIIEERCAPKTLGVAVRDLFREGDDEEKKKEVRGEGYVVDGVFFPFVRAGQPIPRGDDSELSRVVHYFEPVNHKEFVVEIYQSDDPNPRFVPDEPCGRIGPIRFPEDFDVNAHDICVEFDFSETVVRVRVWFGEHEAEGTAIEFFEGS